MNKDSSHEQFSNGVIGFTHVVALILRQLSSDDDELPRSLDDTILAQLRSPVYQHLTPDERLAFLQQMISLLYYLNDLYEIETSKTSAWVNEKILLSKRDK